MFPYSSDCRLAFQLLLTQSLQLSLNLLWVAFVFTLRVSQLIREDFTRTNLILDNRYSLFFDLRFANINTVDLCSRLYIIR